MAKIVATALASNTIHYNGVQFGGSEATYTSTPPQFSLRGSPEYDQSGRAIALVKYTLSLTCIFYSTTESGQATLMNSLRSRLNQVARELKIDGLGTGFGEISYDLKSGPKPGELVMNTIGPIACEVHWSIEFCTKPCSTVITAPANTFLAFNFDTIWMNDYEGISTRTIQGYVEIPHNQNKLTPKIVHHVAEETRGNIIVVCPAGFRRAQNSWHESMDKAKLTFTIVDEQLPGDVFPPGCTLADGEVSFSSGGGPGFAQSSVTMSMMLKTSPMVARNLAYQIFLTAALAKQSQMQQAIQNSQGTVIPRSINIRNRKYDGARITDCSITWEQTGSLGAMLAAAGIWTPLTENSLQAYNLWKASIDVLWDNRGTSGIRSSAEEAVIIDFCDPVQSVTIGNTPSNFEYIVNSNLPAFTCPQIPPDGGWVVHDMEIKVLQKSDNSWHKQAASYIPSIGSINSGMGFPTAGQTQSPSEQDVVEYHGYPSTYIGLRFRGLRYQHKPQVPQIKSVGGLPVVDVTPAGGVGIPKLQYDAFCCPVWSITGVRIYRIMGQLPSGFEPPAIGSPISCETKEVPQDY